MDFLDRIFIPQKNSNDFTFKRYIRDLEDGVFRDRMCLGICDAHGGSYLLKQFSYEPNALYVGAMGSGKSFAACFSLITWMLGNSDQTILFIVDAIKGANDYQALFKYTDSNHVFPILSSEEGIHRVIDLVYEEAMYRRDLFNSVKAESIHAYEKITGRKIARIIIMMEEFHSIPYAILNFERDFKVPQTSAYKFHQIMRIGRTMGTWVMGASQKATKSDIPPEIVPNFTQKQIFRVSRMEASYLLGETRAANIRSNQKGRCETEYGTVQFPFMPLPTQEKLLEKYVKPLDAECAYLTPKIIKDYLGGRSTEELYSQKKLPDLVMGIENLDAELVIRMLHRALGHKIESVNSHIDPNGLSHIITWPTGLKVAIMTRVGDRVKITPKHINKLSMGMKAYGCTRGIIYTSATDLQQGVYRAANDEQIEVVDHEDLVRLARQIDSGTVVPEAISPSELADPSKESGLYQKEHEKKIVAPGSEAAAVPPAKPILQDLIPAFKKETPKIIAKLKRVPQNRMTFVVKKDDPYTVLVHPQRTKSGEIFRVLFYVLNSDYTIKHRWFIDRKLTGVLDEETMTALDVTSVKEWNSQQEPLLDASFEPKIVEFFKNFNMCQFPPILATWAENKSWLEGVVLNFNTALASTQRTTLITPSVIRTYEQYIEEGFGGSINKDELLNNMQPEKMDMYYPLERDRRVWQVLNEDG